MTSVLRCVAPAKVNLHLRILAREAGGYHQIETLFIALDWGDEVALELGAGPVKLGVTGMDVGPVEENLAYRAAVAFAERAGPDRSGRIELTKRIPAGAGLGGGSSDAAAVLTLLDRAYPGSVTAEELRRIAASLGADVPFFLSPTGFALGWGRGDRLLALEPPPSMWLVLILTEVRVSSAEAYGALAEADLTPGGPSGWTVSELADWQAIARFSVNDFERTVFEKHAELASLRADLAASGALFSRMSGSGSAVYGVFEEESVAREAAAAVGTARDGTRAVVAKTRSGGLSISS